VSEEVKASPWFQALMVTPPTICGVQLRPFSIGHEMILSELASPYAVGGPVTDADLLLALQLCSRTVAECREFMAGHRSGLAWWSWKWTRRGLATAHKSFRTYLDDYGNLPALVQTADGSTRHLDASPYWHMARLLCEHYGADLATVWDTAKPIAICAIDAWAESQGTATVASEGEGAILELAQRAQELFEEGKSDEAQELIARAEVMAGAMRAN
jgi:hypothetical protein